MSCWHSQGVDTFRTAVLTIPGMRYFSIRPTTSEDHERVREIRLRMLADTPKAYLEKIDDTLAVPVNEWQERGARGSAQNGTVLVAEDENGCWLGTMGCFIPEPSVGPLLVGVFVDPLVRGRNDGVADDLLAAIENWVITRSDHLTLQVHEDNSRAIAFYLRHGFEFTGQREPYPLAADEWELEMVKKLN